MSPKFTLKPNKASRAEKLFLKNLRVTIRKPCSELPRSSSLNCTLHCLGTTKVIQVLKDGKLFARLEHFQPVIIK